MPAQQRYTVAISASAEWKPWARWLISLTRLFSAFEASVADAELDCCEHAGLVLSNGAGELDERFELGARCPCELRVEALSGLLLREPVDVAQLAEQQERAVHRLVGEHDLGELE
jgi:hypothetical protein